MVQENALTGLTEMAAAHSFLRSSEHSGKLITGTAYLVIFHHALLSQGRLRMA
jgi:hypothetical protein